MATVTSFSGGATFTATLCPADPVAASALPGDIAQVLFDGSAPSFLQLLQGGIAQPIADVAANPVGDALLASLAPNIEVETPEVETPDVAPTDVAPADARPASRRARTGTNDEQTSGVEMLALLTASAAMPASATTSASAAAPATTSAAESAIATAVAVSSDAAATQVSAPKQEASPATDGSVPTVANGSMWSELLEGEGGGDAPMPEQREHTPRFTLPAAIVRTSGASEGNAMVANFNVITRATAQPAVERTVHVSMHSAQWPQAVANEVRWCLDNAVQSATLRITPEHLGPVEIRLEVSDSQVNVNFGAAQADTRAALEQALPKLREMMAGAGLSLGEASVQQQMRRESQDRPALPSSSFASSESQGTAPQRLASLGLIDEYV